MKKMYKFLSFGALFLSSSIWAQCISGGSWGGATVASTGTTVLTTCAYGGVDYSPATITAPGSYIFNSTGGAGNYITITNASNLVLAHGWAPLGYVVPTAGVYRVHLATNSSCGSDATCHTISVAARGFCTSTSQYPFGTVAINPTSGATTTITTFNYAGEYSVNNFSSTGIYTITATGGAGNYLTVKNAAGTVVYASGTSPLSFNVPAIGLYYIHIATTAPPACGTDSDDHTVLVTAPGAIVAPVAPPNDLCANAITLAIPSTTAGTTVNATLETPAPPTCLTPLSQPGVWYKVVGNGNQLGAGLCATAWDSKLFVYQGSCGTWTCVTSNDDAGPLCSGSSASVQWCSVPGVNYFILATGFSSASAFNIAITQTVVAQPTVVVTASSSTICVGTSATLTATGATTYSWTGSLGTTAAITVTPSATTIYTVTGTGATCSTPNVKTFTITTNASPSITVNSGTICSGSSFTMAPSGGTTYTYTGGSAVVSPTTNATYTVTSANVAGCIGSAVSTVTVNARPVVSLLAGGAICSGASYTMVASGATTYTYSSGSAVVSPTATTTYSVTGTNTLGCVSSNTATTTVTITAGPSLTVNSGAICPGGSFTMTPTGGTTYTYTGGSAVVSPTSNATYTVSSTNVAGCIGSAVSTVTVNANPSVTALASNTLICVGNSAVLTASTTATSYAWNTGATTMSISVSPTVTTTYTVNVTDVTTCSSSAVVTVNVSTCTGINEQVAYNVNVYPNPTTGVLNITLTSELTKNSTLEIYDAIGKLIVTEVLSNELNTFNLSNLSNGIYTFKVLNNANMVKLGKLIKQ